MDTVREYADWLLQTIWSCCSGDTQEEEEEGSERARLIRDQQRPGHNLGYGASDRRRNEDLTISRSSGRQRTIEDDQGSLNKILNQTTANIIDIGMMGQTPGVLDQDVSDRTAVYQKRLAAVGSRIAAKHSRKGPPPGEELSFGQVKLLLESEVDPVDLMLATNISKKVETMMADIRVEDRESLVVTFGAHKDT